jgi:hypothetical protein
MKVMKKNYFIIKVEIAYLSVISIDQQRRENVEVRFAYE